MDLTRRYGDRERGSASVEYAGIILVVVAIIAVLVVSGLGSTVATKLGCAVRSVGTQASARETVSLKAASMSTWSCQKRVWGSV